LWGEFYFDYNKSRHCHKGERRGGRYEFQSFKIQHRRYYNTFEVDNLLVNGGEIVVCPRMFSWKFILFG
jgi:hypothetical protein